MRCANAHNRVTVGNYLNKVRLFDTDFVRWSQLQLKSVFNKRPRINSECSFARSCKKRSLERTDEERCDMTVLYGELCDEIFAFIFVEYQIFLGSCPNEEIHIDFFIVLVSECNFIIIGDA